MESCEYCGDDYTLDILEVFRDERTRARRDAE